MAYLSGNRVPLLLRAIWLWADANPRSAATNALVSPLDAVNGVRLARTNGSAPKPNTVFDWSNNPSFWGCSDMHRDEKIDSGAK